MSAGRAAAAAAPAAAAAASAGRAAAPAAAATAAATAAAAAAAAPAAAAAAATNAVGGAGSLLKDNWKSLVPFAIGIAVLGGNIALLQKLAGSSDAWDTIKTKMGGSIAMSFIGALFLSIAMCVYFASYNVGVPMYMMVILVNIGIAVGLSAMSVAAITR